MKLGTATTVLVEKTSKALAGRTNRRGFLLRAAVAGSAAMVAPTRYVLRPVSAYAAVCGCRGQHCDCGSKCCQPWSEFCCTINHGVNACPPGTVAGGWWRSDGSPFCNGPRYFIDCNAACNCRAGCETGICHPECDAVRCSCANGDCNNWGSGCVRFRYGQCHREIDCIGRIVCRVVSCLPPWQVDDNCTTATIIDNRTALHHSPCLGQQAFVAMAPSLTGGGYWLTATDGGVFSFGDAPFRGSMGNQFLRQPVIKMTPTHTGRGYWLLGADGGVFNFGDAGFHGTTSGLRVSQVPVGLAPTPRGDGYWMGSADGGVYSFGRATFRGSLGGRRLNRPVVGIAGSPSGSGYWLVASDGGIFNFGDAGFFGSAGNLRLIRPIVGMARTPTGRGYWLVASDGGIFTYGDAGFFGSMGGRHLNRPVVGMAPTPTGRGYWLIAQDGGIFSFGDARFFGSRG